MMLDLVKLLCGKAIKETITIVNATSEKGMLNFYTGFMRQMSVDALDIVEVKICCTTKFVNVHVHCKFSVEPHTQVPHCRGWQHMAGADCECIDHHFE